jgi:stage III sporulation protein AF
MLSFLKEWIISVAAMIIFMVLIDLILPSNNFRKYAKFVTGLIVIVTILSPVFKLFDKNIDAATVISDYTESFNKTSSEIDRNKIQSNVKKQTIDVFKSNLKKSIEKEIYNELEKKYLVSEICIIEDSLSLNFGDIKNITLKRESEDKVVKPVEKIVIGNSKTEDKQAPRDTKVIEVLKNKYNIDPSSVKFIK